jgi:hypothetical protein
MNVRELRKILRDMDPEAEVWIETMQTLTGWMVPAQVVRPVTERELEDGRVDGPAVVIE